MGNSILQCLLAVVLLTSVGTVKLAEGYFQFGSDVGTGNVRRLEQTQGNALSSLPDWKQELEGYEEARRQDRSKDSSVGAMDRLARAKEIMKAWTARSNASLQTRSAPVGEQAEPVPGPLVENTNQQHQTSHQAEVQAQESQEEKVKQEAEEEEARQMQAREAQTRQAQEAAQEARRQQAEARHEQALVGEKSDLPLVKASRSHSPTPAAVVPKPPPPAPMPAERKSASASSGLDRILNLIKSRQRNSAALGNGQSDGPSPAAAAHDSNMGEESRSSAKHAPAKPPPKPSHRRSRRLTNFPMRRSRTFSSSRSRNSDSPPPEGSTKYSKELAKYYSYSPAAAMKLPPQFSGPMPKCTTKQDCPSPLHSCLDGVCTCPPILRGNADCTKQTPVSPNRGNCFAGLLSREVKRAVFGKDANDTSISFLLEDMMGESGENDLNRRQDWSSCAVVGSSDSMKIKKQGKLIDGHPSVIRFNNAPTRAFTRYAGKSTTLRVQNFDYCGAAEYRDEICINYTMKKQCSHKLEKSKLMRTRCQGDNLVTVSKLFSTYVYAYWELNQPKDMLDPACQWICPKRGLKATGTIIKPSLRIPRDSDLLAAMKECKRRCNKKTSSGFFGILLASHLCGKVDVYGFGTDSSRSLGYYFPKIEMVNRSGRNPPQYRHHWKFERFCLNYLRGSGIPGLTFH